MPATVPVLTSGRYPVLALELEVPATGLVQK